MAIFTIDGVSYDAATIRPATRRVEPIVDGVTAGILQNGREICDIVGSKLSFELTVEPRDSAAYDALFNDINRPINPRMVTLPYGSGTVTFAAKLTADSDQLRGTAGGNRWGGMRLQITAMEPVNLP